MKENCYTIEAMCLEDIPEVLRLEREAFGQMAWHADDFESAITSKCDFPLVIHRTMAVLDAAKMVDSSADVIARLPKSIQTDEVQDAEGDGIGIVGYAVLRIIAPEAEIENICVAPTYRRTGAGDRLMDEMLCLATNQGADRIFLEVRAHNEPAKALYRKKGFVDSYVRKNYYQGPAEDAIIMMKE